MKILEPASGSSIRGSHWKFIKLSVWSVLIDRTERVPKSSARRCVFEAHREWSNHPWCFMATCDWLTITAYDISGDRWLMPTTRDRQEEWLLCETLGETLVRRSPELFWRRNKLAISTLLFAVCKRAAVSQLIAPGSAELAQLRLQLRLHWRLQRIQCEFGECE